MRETVRTGMSGNDKSMHKTSLLVYAERGKYKKAL
jgi:hypothetical protein